MISTMVNEILFALFVLSLVSTIFWENWSDGSQVKQLVDYEVQFTPTVLPLKMKFNFQRNSLINLINKFEFAEVYIPSERIIFVFF